MNLARRISMVAGLLALIGPTASAQMPASTGVDNTWQVSYRRVPDPFTAFMTATHVINGPWYAWQANTASYGWISASADASQPNSIGDGSHRYDYTFQTSFSLGADAASTGFLFRCAIDNSGGTYRVNGGAWQQAGCGVFSFSSQQTVSGFQTGTNTLEFAVWGDGTTDGLVVALDKQVTVTPEPGSLVLMASGFVGLGALSWRRRRQPKADTAS